jgi:methionyl-tRNA formyltransferase
MGTPDFASVSLSYLLGQPDFTVVGVLTQPDKPKGRHMTLTPPPVKVLAMEKGIPVWQPETLKEGAIADLLTELQPDAIAVVAYGKLLPEYVLNYPKYGCINVHGSLLPAYRGAAPMQRAVMAGEETVGVTTMKMAKGMDTGDILTQEEVLIGENETAEELFDRLAVISAELMVKTIDDIENITPRKQDEAEATYAPIIKKEMALLDFSKPAERLFNEIRGYYSWPCAYLFLGGKRVKVITANVGGNINQQAGTVVGNDDCLEIACGDGKTLKLLTVQPEGKGQMTAKQMLCGNKIEKGYVING